VLILGIETATEQVGCAIGGHEGVLAQFEACRGRRHAEVLTPAIEFTCKAASVRLDEIGVVAVDIGPGLFTGLRVGLATGKAIAHALRIPMIGISSLDLLAYPLRFADRLVATVLDAKRGELFSALYRQSPGGIQRMTQPDITTIDELVAELEAVAEDVLAVGDGAVRHKARLTGLARLEVADQWLAHPSAAPLVQLAHAKALREDWVNPWELEPLYLRRPDAEINWSTRHDREVAS
jgi:tRNA threonylcarbamoyladenosine biosynthesis protein TsaB